MYLASGTPRNIHGWLLISSILLNAAFLWPSYYCWTIFIFLMPLYYGIRHIHTSYFYYGFFWGFSFFAIHFFELYLLFYRHAFYALSFFIPLLLVGYCALYAGIWWHISSIFVHRWPSLKGVVWIISTVLFFYGMNHAILWIFGVPTGYCFFNPLLPCMAYPWLLSFLPYVPMPVLLGLIASMNWIVVAMWVKKNHKSAWTVPLIAAPFLVGFVREPLIDAQTKTLLARCIYVNPAGECRSSLDCAQTLTKHMQRALAAKPGADYLLLPESAFPYDLVKDNDALAMWAMNVTQRNEKIFLGGHMSEDNKLYNAFFVIDNTRITHCYVKNTRMIFTEYIPAFWTKCPHCKNLFLKKKKEFATKNKEPAILPIDPFLSIEPAICSDMYLCSCHDRYPVPRMVLVNDSWFSSDYFKRMMLLYASYMALSYQRIHLYIGHFGGYIIDKYGQTYEL